MKTITGRPLHTKYIDFIFADGTCKYYKFDIFGSVEREESETLLKIQDMIDDICQECGKEFKDLKFMGGALVHHGSDQGISLFSDYPGQSKVITLNEINAKYLLHFLTYQNVGPEPANAPLSIADGHGSFRMNTEDAFSYSLQNSYSVDNQNFDLIEKEIIKSFPNGFEFLSPSKWPYLHMECNEEGVNQLSVKIGEMENSLRPVDFSNSSSENSMIISISVDENGYISLNNNSQPINISGTIGVNTNFSDNVIRVVDCKIMDGVDQLPSPMSKIQLIESPQNENQCSADIVGDSDDLYDDFSV